ncbi:MAG: metallophosphoesterase family protein, partial [Candidatus Hodarchaeales archaeon]
MVERTPGFEEAIIFSDSHISKYTGLFNEKAFETGVSLIAKKIKDNPDAFVLHLGDITDSGTYEDYRYAKKLLDRKFGNLKNFFAIPGNHDMRNIGDKLWKDFFGERQFLIDTTDKGGNLIILGIDSSEPDENIGRIGDRGIEAINELSTFPDDIVKILCFHHHMVPIPNTGRERSMILDAGDVMQIIWDAGIDVIITAHRHYPNIFSLSDGTRRCVLINSGTFSSFKTRGIAGHTFVHLQYNGSESDKNILTKFHGIEYELESFHGKRKSRFQKPEERRFQLDRGNILTDAGYLVPG